MATKLVTGTPVSVPVPGTAVPLTAASPLPRATTSLVLQSDPDNKKDIYVGDSTVTALNGLVISPGSIIEFAGIDRRLGQDELIINDIHIDAVNADEFVRVAFFVRRSGVNP